MTRLLPLPLLLLAGLFPLTVLVGVSRAAPDPLAEAILAKVRDTARTDKSLNGILVYTATAEGKHLALQGYASTRDELAALKKSADALIAAKADWKKRFPEGATVAKMQMFSVLVAALQKALAESKMPLDRLTRLDAVSFDGVRNTLALHGNNLVLGQKADAVRNQLAIRLDRLVKAQLPANTEVTISTQHIHVLPERDHPVVALMQRLQGNGHDDVLFWVSYDRTGTLLLDGVVGQRDHRKYAEAFLSEKPGGKVRPGLRPTSPAGAQPYQIRVREVAWPYTPARVRKLLAGSDESLLRQTRLDRMYFRYQEPEVFYLHFVGVRLHEDGDELIKHLKNKVIPLGKDLKLPQSPDIDIQAVPAIPFAKVSSEFQKLILDNPETRGTWLTDQAYFDTRGILHFTGLRKGTLPSKALRKLAVPLLTREHRSLLTPGILFQEKDFLPTPELKELRRALASSPSLLLRQTHLEQLSFGKPKAKLRMRFGGICVHPVGTSTKIRTELAGEMSRLIRKLYPMLGDSLAVDTGGINVQGDKDNPLRALMQQFHANEDDEVFLSGHYDAEGVFQLEGVVGQERYLAKIDDWFRAEGARRVGGNWSRRQVRVVRWPLARKHLQGALASDSGPELLRQTRVDRVYFVYTRTGLQLRLQGVCCHQAEEMDNARELARHLQKLTSNLATPLKIQQPWQVDTAGIQTVLLGKAPGNRLFIASRRAAPGGVARLQRKVASTPSLDGVLVRSKAYFDREGRLHLTGLWAGSHQQKQLEQVARQVLGAVRGGILIQRGVVADRTDFAPSGTDGLLNNLRLWAAETKNDTWLDRLFFPGTRVEDRDVLELRVLSASRAGNLIRDIQTIFSTGIRVAPDVRHLALQPSVQLKVRGRSLARSLRWVLKDPPPTWDGIMIQRGYYAPKGDYLVTGLVAEKSQVDQLRRLSGDLARQIEWTSFSGKGKEVRMEVVPIQPMLETLCLVMPADPKFDGVQLTGRAHHDQNNNLVLRCRVAGKAPGAEVVASLKNMIEKNPSWRKRVTRGLLLRSAKPTRADGEVTQDLIVRAVEALSSGRYQLGNTLTQRAVLVAPDNSTVWFLSAWCSLVIQRDVRAVKRDLRRMHLLEPRREGLTRLKRLRATEDLHLHRRYLNQLGEEVVREIAREEGPLTIDDVLKRSRSESE